MSFFCLSGTAKGAASPSCERSEPVPPSQPVSRDSEMCFWTRVCLCCHADGSHPRCFIPPRCSGWGGVCESGLRDVGVCACDLEMPPQADILVCSAAQEV